MIDALRELLGLIAQYGLPVVLTVYFVVRMDKQISKFISMLGAFITWMQAKSTEDAEHNKEGRAKQEALLQLATEAIQRIRILEVRLEK